MSTVSRILRFDDIERRLADPPVPVVVSDAFPTDGHHGRKWGRPADVLVAADGSLLVSDDQAGAIYRIRYRGQ